MKILYNIAGTYRSGGMERVLANKVNWLAKHGYEVVVATTDQCGRTPFFQMDERVRFVDLGVNYEETNGKSFLNKLWNFFPKQRLHKKRLNALLRQECPDVTVSMFCNDVNFLAGLRDGSKKILEIHFAKLKRLQYGRKGIWGLADHFLMKVDECKVRKFDRFVVLTEEDKQYWKSQDNIQVIPNALTFDGDEVSSLSHHKAIAVGRLTYQKGFDRLIEAWEFVNECCPDWKLDIVGSGEDRETLNQMIIEKGLAKVVNIVDSTEDMPSVYLHSSLLILTSRYEGFGLVLTEAHSFGVPTVSYDCKCGPSEIVQNGVNGFLVEEGNVEKLAEKIIQILQDDDLRCKMGKAAKLSSKDFAEEKVMSQWENLFKGVVR